MSAVQFDSFQQRLICKGCHKTEPLSLPRPLAELGALLRSFDEAHASCQVDETVAEDTKRMTPEEWLFAGDTGVSSLTIFSVMTNRPEVLGRFGADAPYDPGDFGRCHRLLERFPEWRERLPEVADRYPVWRDLVREWAELTALYEKELSSGRAPALYQRIRELRGH